MRAQNLLHYYFLRNAKFRTNIFTSEKILKEKKKASVS
tara:strand:- start:1229 stop:1342 length:114 start_codon:yes stop_codon:yes gene_type:complete